MGGNQGNTKYLKRGQIISTAFKLQKTLSPTHLDMENELNRHFTLVAKQTEERLIKPKHHYFKYLKNANSNSFFMTPTNNEVVPSQIKNLRKDKSSGTSSSPVKILKLFQIPLSKPISLIAN